MNTIKKNDIIELEIESYAFEGKGVAKIEKSLIDKFPEETDKKYVIFVNGSYPGDRVLAQIKKLRRSYAEANVKEIISSSPERISTRCSFFGTCGGCKQQDLDYKAQLKYKEEQVKDIFQRLGGFDNFIVEPILAADEDFFYRNKMEFSFSDKRWLYEDEISSSNDIKDRNFALGLHIPKIFDKVLDINKCFLQSNESNRILNFTRDFFKSKETTIYSTKTHSGYLRHLVIKQSKQTNDLMVNLVTSEDNERLFTKYCEELFSAVPEISTVVNNISTKKAKVAIGDFERIYHGNGYIFDKIGPFLFRISANSFFQTNTIQAEKLYETAKNLGELSKNDVVFDLYSGAGTIAVYIANQVRNVFAFENVDSAVEDAKVNRELNKIDNIKFIQADLNKSFIPVAKEKNLPKPNVIIVDPPRSGMNPKTVKDILKLEPEKIVYVSCNPTTQVRDIKLLSEKYRLIKIRPVDMFPHTYHIENVALLAKDIIKI